MGPVGAVGGGLGIIGVLITLLLGGNVLGGGGGGGNGATTVASDPSDQQGQFVEDAVGDIQGFWTDEFARNGRQYQETKLVLFTQATNTGCGYASAETGPFYCPPDEKVFIDLGFFQELSDRFGAPGDFARAYVVAHEFGHHVQHLLRLDDNLQQGGNEASVRFELQADCLAGVWGHSADERGVLEAGDVEEGLAAAASVGDDRIQKQVQGRVDPETFTHGSSAQRVASFQRGFTGGRLQSCIAA
jgi:predicted metalloprotease